MTAAERFDLRDPGAEVLLRRPHGVLRLALLTGAPRQLQLLLRFEIDGDPAPLLAALQRRLRRLHSGSMVELPFYQVSGRVLLVQARIRLAGRPSSARLARLETQLQHLASNWGDHVQRLLVRRVGAERAALVWSQLAPVCSADYRGHTPARFAARDLTELTLAAEDGGERFALWGPLATAQGLTYRLQHYAVAPVSLNLLLPLLDNLGLLVEEEHDFVFPLDERTLHLKSFVVRGPGNERPLVEVREPLLQLLTALRRGAVENDDLNRLLVATGLDWYQIDIFRGYRNYLFQLGSPFSRHRVALALIAHPAVTVLLYRYFAARFAPHGGDREQREDQELFPLRQALAAALEAVADASFDRILRTLFNLIDATVRTSFYRRRAADDYFFAFKISDLGLLDLPTTPLYEIYVHAAAMEGIHLRGGLVARGGIRWSDRPDDFRTEILGLLKTQMIKNVVIVPVGSKGGFVVKAAAATQSVESGRQAYATLMRGLLDLTDNRIAGQPVRPPEVVAYDGDDSYLVVAADKGTAHFSDLANAISAEYGFWLGDAFASGGSHGYDHKRLAITARGAWECVKVHFRELGRDIEQQPLTVVGIGDMSGDVFGNGLLRSRTIRLLAAFDHRHIFLDPTPDAERSYVERARLFALPVSSWDDYDRSVLSPGGGIFRRDAKEIELTPQVRDWLKVRHTSIDPAGLIRLLLAAEVDLLWNGGIGTYVKARDEKAEEVGDRANDAVRIDAAELRARVVGEGGNLGFTQRGRVEYALAGGRINTDAIDNSGGVDCSDHEVNLKVLLAQLRAGGHLASDAERDQLLDAVSDEVCDAVLEDNRSQSLCLSLEERRCREGVEPYLTLLTRLADSGLLDRKAEQLPDAEALRSRGVATLVRPELAVVMAYAKMHLYQALLESPLPDSPAARQLLTVYFPTLLRQRFAGQLAAHPLAREISATMLANRLVNQGGSTLVLTLQRTTGAGPARIAEAYLALDQVLEAATLRQMLRTLPAGLAVEPGYPLLLRLETTLVGLCREVLTAGQESVLTAAALPVWRQRLADFRTLLAAQPQRPEQQDHAAELAALRQAGCSAELLAELASLERLDDWWPSMTLAERSATTLAEAWQVLTAVREHFSLWRLERQVAALSTESAWEQQARQTLAADLRAVGVALAEVVLSRAHGELPRYLRQHPEAEAVAASLAAMPQYGAGMNLMLLLEALQQLQGLVPVAAAEPLP